MVVAGVLMKQEKLLKKTVRSGARTYLDLRVGSSAFVLYAVWGDGTSLNFDNFRGRQKGSGKKKKRWRAEEEALGSSSA